MNVRLWLSLYDRQRCPVETKFCPRLQLQFFRITSRSALCGFSVPQMRQNSASPTKPCYAQFANRRRLAWLIAFSKSVKQDFPCDLVMLDIGRLFHYGVGPIYWINSTLDQNVYADILHTVISSYNKYKMPLKWGH